MYLANGTNTTNATLAETYVYHVVLKKLITGTSVNTILSTTPNTMITLPMEVQTSSPPLAGHFKITCPLMNNDIALNPITTADISIGHNTHDIKYRIYKACMGAYDKLDVVETGRFPYR
jgi:hypothetical protein